MPTFCACALNLSRSSMIRRSAVFLPMPGTRTRRPTSPPAMVSERPVAPSPDRAAQGQPGPDAGHRQAQLEGPPLVDGGEAVKRQRVLAHLQVGK